jgi:hypothetical protein
MVAAPFGRHLETTDWYPLLVRLSASLPIYVVEPTAGLSHVRVWHDRARPFVVVAVPRPFTFEHHGEFHELLSEHHHIRPLLLFEDASETDFLTGTYARMKVLFGTGCSVSHLLQSDAETRETVRAQCSLLLTADPMIAQTAGPLFVERPLPTVMLRPDTSLDEVLRPPVPSPVDRGPGLRVLMLYDDNFSHVGAVKEYLQSFADHSRHEISYAVGVNNVIAPNSLDGFDVLVLHYSVRLYLGTHLSPTFAAAIRRFGGLKCLFIQDEYDVPAEACRWIRDLGIHTIFTCVPEASQELVYPSSVVPRVERIQVLTGYVPKALESAPRGRPIAERSIVLGYRGRALAPWYGDLAREKLEIGRRMKQICVERGIPCDIEWADDKRIYGDRWLAFISSCRATLGTESGCNVLDPHGDVRRRIQEAIADNPGLPYDDIREKYLAGHDGVLCMNQVSPRIFEAVALRTALVLFEGTYSGVVIPDVHFIPLKKDFSNIDEVLDRLRDTHELEAMTERAWGDVVGSGRYSYRTFVELFDDHVAGRVPGGRPLEPVWQIIAWRDRRSGFTNVTEYEFTRGRAQDAVLSAETDQLMPIHKRGARRILPRWIIEPLPRRRR